MNGISAPLRGWAVDAAVFVLHTCPWQSVCCGLLGVALVRLLAERARRRTLLALVTQAPPGTVVTQERGTGGPGMRVEVGGGQPPPGERD